MVAVVVMVVAVVVMAVVAVLGAAAAAAWLEVVHGRWRGILARVRPRGGGKGLYSSSCFGLLGRATRADGRMGGLVCVGRGLYGHAFGLLGRATRLRATMEVAPYPKARKGTSAQ